MTKAIKSASWDSNYNEVLLSAETSQWSSDKIRSELKKQFDKKTQLDFFTKVT